MKVNAVTAGIYVFKGYSDEIRQAREILKDNSAFDDYLSTGKTVIIEKVEINDSGKSSQENLKKVGQGVATGAAGAAGGAAGTLMAKAERNAKIQDNAVLEPDSTETDGIAENLSDQANATEDVAENVADTLSSEDYAEITEEMGFGDDIEATGGMFGFIKDFFKSLLDID